VAAQERLDRMIERMRFVLGDTAQDRLAFRSEVGPEQSEMLDLSVIDPLVWTMSRWLGSSMASPRHRDAAENSELLASFFVGCDFLRGSRCECGSSGSFVFVEQSLVLGAPLEDCVAQHQSCRLPRGGALQYVGSEPVADQLSDCIGNVPWYPDIEKLGDHRLGVDGVEHPCVLVPPVQDANQARKPLSLVVEERRPRVIEQFRRPR
jgi:hypothetical protein